MHSGRAFLLCAVYFIEVWESCPSNPGIFCRRMLEDYQPYKICSSLVKLYISYILDLCMLLPVKGNDSVLHNQVVNLLPNCDCYRALHLINILRAEVMLNLSFYNSNGGTSQLLHNQVQILFVIVLSGSLMRFVMVL